MSHCRAPSLSPALAVAKEAALASDDQSLEHGSGDDAVRDVAAVHEAEGAQCLVQTLLCCAVLVCQVLLGMQPRLGAVPVAAGEAAAVAAAALKRSCPGGALAIAACADVAAAAAAAGALVEATAVAGADAVANEALHAHSVAAASAAAAVAGGMACLIAMQQHTVHALLEAAHQSLRHAGWWI